MKISLRLTAASIITASFCSISFAQQFTDVSTAVGLVHEKQKTWGNPVWGDINNDGYLDLIVPTHGLSASHGPFIYLNNNGQTFTDIRSTSGIGAGFPLDDGDWHGYGFGDYDGDGNLDVYIAEGAKGQQGGTIKRDNLYRGNGDGTFNFVSDTAGLEISMNRGRCPYWFDYNNDGRLDLFVKNYGGLNVLYKGNGDGTLSSVPGAGGLAEVALGEDNGSIMSFADYDNDGYMDFILTGDANTQALYHNQGDGTFVDATAAAGMTQLPNGKGVSWGDYNNDGFLDIFIARAKQGKLVSGTSLYRNNGNGTFTDVTESAGLEVFAACWTGIWGDYDNDGYLDLFITDSGDTGEGTGNANFLFHNNGNGTFTNVAASAGVAMEDGSSLHKGAAWADYNNDGFLDLIVKDGIGNEDDQGDDAKGYHFLFKNNGNTNHFIKINLKGVQSNLHGIGARVQVKSPIGTIYRQNNGGGGGEQASEGSEPLHFGIGTATKGTIQVKWPSGIVDTVKNVSGNSTVTIVEGSGAQSEPPVITSQPRNRRVTVGQPANFIVVATGDAPLSYQWRKNGHDIAGANGAQYATPPTTLDDDGSVFSVVVSNSAGTATSRNARLAVTAAR